MIGQRIEKQQTQQVIRKIKSGFYKEERCLNFLFLISMSRYIRRSSTKYAGFTLQLQLVYINGKHNNSAEASSFGVRREDNDYGGK
uniref:Uncharacterized protein n=1 Tax=Echinococcus granulosus TaxID=6210 RepID=A0A068WWX9_ECHGR|nr:hypothetical protein EgrG_000937600 [Echinococcus granulosus]